MNPANLPFDSEAMLAGSRPGWNAKARPGMRRAVERMLDIAAREMAIMGATIERIAGRQGFAGCVRARFPHPKQGEPGILIAGHLDTVHPVGTLEKLPWRREGDKCYGPGIFDMKGGNYSTLEAIRQLARAAFTTPLPITVPVHPRRRGRHALHPRPHRGGSRAQQICAGAGAGPRRTTASSPAATPSRASISKPSASRAMPAPRLSSGRSAIREMARQILAIDGMTTDGLHLLRRHRSWRPVGQLRRDHLHRRGAEHGQAPGRSRPRRRADAGAVGHRQ